MRTLSNIRNLQNLPSGSVFGKLIKNCFESEKGWLFVGSDMDSLESKINALLTRDENQMSVYTDGFDGHCLRSFFYFREQMPDIRLVEENSRLFEVKTKSKTHCIKGGTVIKCPNGQVMKIEEYFDNIKKETTSCNGWVERDPST